MSKRPKYHFLTATQKSIGKIISALPGQTFGRTPVPTSIMVQDIKGNTIISRARQKTQPGEILYTTSLKMGSHSLKAADIAWLDDAKEDIMKQDVEKEFNNYLHSLSQ